MNDTSIVCTKSPSATVGAAELVITQYSKHSNSKSSFLGSIESTSKQFLNDAFLLGVLMVTGQHLNAATCLSGSMELGVLV